MHYFSRSGSDESLFEGACVTLTSDESSVAPFLAGKMLRKASFQL